MKIIGERSLLTTRIFGVSEIILEKKDGTAVKHAVVRFVKTISVLPVTADGQIVLERQFRSAVGGWVVETPAGKIDGDEDPYETVSREVEEEIGYRVHEAHLVGEGWVSCGYTDEYMYYFIARVEAIPPTARHRFPDHDEEIETIAVTLEEALAMIERREITDAKTILLVFAYAREQNR